MLELIKEWTGRMAIPVILPGSLDVDIVILETFDENANDSC